MDEASTGLGEGVVQALPMLVSVLMVVAATAGAGWLWANGVQAVKKSAGFLGALVGSVLGGLLGGAMLAAVGVDAHPAIPVVLGLVVGLILALLFVKYSIAAVCAIVFSLAGVAGTAVFAPDAQITRGPLHELGTDLAAPEDESADEGSPLDSLVNPFAPPSKEEVLDTAKEAGQQLSAEAYAFGAQVLEAAKPWWEQQPAGRRALFVFAGVLGAAVGFGVGMVLPGLAGIIASSALGAGIMLGGGAWLVVVSPLAVPLERVPELVWLGAWAVVLALGVAVQIRRRGQRAGENS